MVKYNSFAEVKEQTFQTHFGVKNNASHLLCNKSFNVYTSLHYKYNMVVSHCIIENLNGYE